MHCAGELALEAVVTFVLAWYRGAGTHALSHSRGDMTLLRTARVFTALGDDVLLFLSLDGNQSLGRRFEYEVEPRRIRSPSLSVAW